MKVDFMVEPVVLIDISGDDLYDAINKKISVFEQEYQNYSGINKSYFEKLTLLDFLKKSSFLNAMCKDQKIVIEKRERPDFLVTREDGKFGFEVTRVVNPWDKEALCRNNRRLVFFGKCNPQNTQAGSKNKKSNHDEYIEAISTSHCSNINSGYRDSELVGDWKDWLLQAINSKLEKYNKDSFEKFDKNFILVEDQTSQSFLADLSGGDKELRCVLKHLKDALSSEERVSIAQNLYIMVKIRNTWFDCSSEKE
jgi:hypothetical protein